MKKLFERLADEKLIGNTTDFSKSQRLDRLALISKIQSEDAANAAVEEEKAFNDLLAIKNNIGAKNK